MGAGLGLNVPALLPAGLGDAGRPCASFVPQVDSDGSGQWFSGGSRGRSQSGRDSGLALTVLPGLLTVLVSSMWTLLLPLRPLFWLAL